MKHPCTEALTRLLVENLPLIRALETPTWFPLIDLGKTEPKGWVNKRTQHYVLGVTKPEEDE